MGRLLGDRFLLGSPRWRFFSLGIASVGIASIMAMAACGVAEAATHKKTPAKHTESKADSDECKPTPEQASIGIRALQTELMVAGLKCSAEQFNAFTAQFKATIKKDADRMQGVFRKVYGKGGATEMNAFVTQLANDASQRSNGSSEEDYCKQEDVLFQKVLALTGEQLERFSAGRKLEIATPVALCKPDPETPDAKQAAATPAMVTTAAATGGATMNVH